ncbi:MAG: PD40 domain-containing protein [Bacteroidia bacterium]|nr:PD40 domain-containing protein [Bacteroidia bacterium]
MSNFKSLPVIVALLLNPALYFAQMPVTDIWLFKIKKDTSANKYSFVNAKKINTGNRYNNQPSFTPDSKQLLFVSSTDTLQTDVYALTLQDSSIEKITDTRESEYSPVMYEADKISVVRVDMDKAQRLYSLNKENDFNAGLLVNFNDSVAYYGWIGKNDVALAVLNNKKMELQIFNLPSQQYISLMSEKAGRCFGSITSGEVCYMIKTTDSTGTIMRYDLQNEMTAEWCPALKHSDDFAITPEGNVWMGYNGNLYEWNHKKSEWIMLADFKETPGNFYRLAVSKDGNWLALVTYQGNKP